MGNRSTLSLMEQSLMLLLFALAAALCLQAFAWAGRTARETADLDRAVIEVQNIAEELKAAGAPLSAPLQICYDSDWQICDPAAAAYRLTAKDTSDTDGLCKADIFIGHTEKNIFIFELTAAWQEVRR